METLFYIYHEVFTKLYNKGKTFQITCVIRHATISNSISNDGLKWSQDGIDHHFPSLHKIVNPSTMQLFLHKMYILFVLFNMLRYTRASVNVKTK